MGMGAPIFARPPVIQPGPGVTPQPPPPVPKPFPGIRFPIGMGAKGPGIPRPIGGKGRVTPTPGMGRKGGAMNPLPNLLSPNGGALYAQPYQQFLDQQAAQPPNLLSPNQQFLAQQAAQPSMQAPIQPAIQPPLQSQLQPNAGLGALAQKQGMV